MCIRDSEYGVRLICVGQTIRRHLAGKFNANVRLLAQYLKTVLERLPLMFIGHIGVSCVLQVLTCHKMVYI